MENIVNVIVNNGIGVGSFLALLYFMNIFINDIKTTTEETTKTLVSIQDNLTTLSERVDKIEEKSIKR